MNKKFLIIPIIISGFVLFSLSSGQTTEKNEPFFHVTLASPQQYQNGVYSSEFELIKGDYLFRFVPNGDSPKILSITLKGENFEFTENFKLKGELHDTGISEYYTWDYEGQKLVHINSNQEVTIMIDPNENLLGSVSVDLIENQ